MKRFIDLEIKASEEILIEFLDKLKAAETNKWKFEKKFTKDYALNISLQENKVACFKANSTKYFEATIWIVINKNNLRVANIVSRKVSCLGKELYNTIVTDFYNDFVCKHAHNKLEISITHSDLTIEELANNETAQKLKDWEANYNRSTGNAHPLDREWWFEFIITAVKTNSSLTTEILEQWLTEEKNWILEDNNITENIIHDFEYGKDLLEYYVRENKKK
jgi:hypothetical protein